MIKNNGVKTSVVKAGEVVEQDFKDMNEKLGLNNIKVHQAPKLIISSLCHSHIRALHVHSPGTEWLALCRIEPQGNGVFKLVDMIHPEQKKSSAECEPTDKGLDWAVDYLIEQKENLGQWNCILHSHHHMGCFWSGTDDKARLGYNDGRFMCWAVVTAYSGEPENGEISYKGCVNFYKPYNIEVDAEIEIEGEDYYKECKEFEQFDDKRNKEIKDLADTMFQERVMERINEVEELDTLPDYSRVINYLGIDISNELNENYKEVQLKMPNKKLEEFYEDIYQEVEKEAIDIIGQEPATISDEALEWKEWSDALVKQLDDHTYETVSSYGNWGNYNWEKNKKKEKEKSEEKVSQKALDFYNYDHTYEDDGYYLKDNYFYNEENYPNKEYLRAHLGLSPTVGMYLQDGVRTAYNPYSGTREPLDDCLDQLLYMG